MIKACHSRLAQRCLINRPIRSSSTFKRSQWWNSWPQGDVKGTSGLGVLGLAVHNLYLCFSSEVVHHLEGKVLELDVLQARWTSVDLGPGFWLHKLMGLCKKERKKALQADTED